MSSGTRLPCRTTLLDSSSLAKWPVERTVNECELQVPCKLKAVRLYFSGTDLCLEGLFTCTIPAELVNFSHLSKEVEKGLLL